MSFTFYSASKTQNKYSERPALFFLKFATFPANSECKAQTTDKGALVQQKLHSPLSSRESYLPKQSAKTFFCTLLRDNPATRHIQASSLQLNILLQQASKPLSPHLCQLALQ